MSPHESGEKEGEEQMSTQKWFRKITTASSLAGLAAGFLLLGILILSKENSEGVPTAAGVVGILLGMAFLMLFFLYWRREALKS
jgi:hypothetical protein